MLRVPKSHLAKFSIIAAGLLAVIYFLFQASDEFIVLAPQSENDVTPDITKPFVQLDPIYFTGDVMLGRHVEILGNRNGTAYLTKHFAPLFASSSAVVINFESAMARPHEPTGSGIMRFSTAPALLAVLDELRVTHASLANNHALDYGHEGYTTTVNELRDKGVVAFGHPTKVASTSLTYIPYGSSTIAVLGLHTLFMTLDQKAITAIVSEAKESSALVVAYVHWGNEYELTHSNAQREFARSLAAAGVDLLIGHHPHVVQDIAVVDGMPVLYSLGNFIFDQYFSPDVQTGLIVTLSVQEDTFTIGLVPHRQCERSVPCLMAKTEEEEFLTALAARSDFETGQIMAKKLTFSR